MSRLEWRLLTKKREGSIRGLPGKEELAWVTDRFREGNAEIILQEQ